MAAHGDDSSTIGKHLQVFVRDNNVDQALRVLKKKMQREGVFREMRRRKAYEKSSERRTREKTEAIRRARKAARKQADRRSHPEPQTPGRRAPSAAQAVLSFLPSRAGCLLGGPEVSQTTPSCAGEGRLRIMRNQLREVE